MPSFDVIRKLEVRSGGVILFNVFPFERVVYATVHRPRKRCNPAVSVNLAGAPKLDILELTGDGLSRPVVVGLPEIEDKPGEGNEHKAVNQN